jgi:hypothetical protein
MAIALAKLVLTVLAADIVAEVAAAAFVLSLKQPIP